MSDSSIVLDTEKKRMCTDICHLKKSKRKYFKTKVSWGFFNVLNISNMKQNSSVIRSANGIIITFV